jgi:hypothetical protein
MKSFVSRKTRLKIGKTYLHFFNRLPQFRGGVIRTYQDISEHHAKQAKETYERSRSPKEVTLRLLYFRLIEVFNLEDFDDLRDGIFRLFPGLRDDFFDRLSAVEFTRQAESIRGTASGMLGYILRDKSRRWLGMDAYREIPTLPPQVDFIEVQYHKILPSIFLITLDVHLTDDATDDLLSIQGKLYEPTIRFRNLLPWRSPFGSYSETHSETEMRTAVLSWLEQLRAKINTCIKPFLSGYFTTQKADSTGWLPTIEVYALKGAPEDITAFGEWSRKCRDWLDSLGFSFFWEVYTNGPLIFTPPDRLVTKRSSAYRLVVLWDRYVQSVGTAGHGGDEKRAITYNTKYVLDAFGSLIVLHEFLNSIEKSVARLRKITFRSMRNRVRFLGRYMRLNKIVLRESILLDRIPMEVRQSKGLIEHKARSIGEFKEVKPDFTRIEEESFLAHAIANLEARMQYLKEQVEHIKQTFSDFLALQNMRAIYTLQWVVIVLSIIAIITGVFQVIGNWPNIRQFFKDVLGITV